LALALFREGLRGYIMRIKIIKSGKYKSGEIVTLSKPEALKLIQKGIAIMTKDMTSVDYGIS